jgi:hypothetical protein
MGPEQKLSAGNKSRMENHISRDLPWQKRCCYQKPSILICGLSSLMLITDKMFPDNFITDSYLLNMQNNRQLNGKRVFSCTMNTKVLALPPSGFS